jgi:hypothetical protein
MIGLRRVPVRSPAGERLTPPFPVRRSAQTSVSDTSPDKACYVTVSSITGRKIRDALPPGRFAAATLTREWRDRHSQSPYHSPGW